jgi:hypothetical protein
MQLSCVTADMSEEGGEVACGREVCRVESDERRDTVTPLMAVCQWVSIGVRHSLSEDGVTQCDA